MLIPCNVRLNNLMRFSGTPQNSDGNCSIEPQKETFRNVYHVFDSQLCFGD